MAVTGKEASKMLANLKRAGATIGKGATKFLMPLAGTGMVYQAVKAIPGIGGFISGLENVEKFVMENTLEKIPVIGWVFTAARKAADFIRGNNDREWYDPDNKLKIPANMSRPMGINYSKDIFGWFTKGSIPKFGQLIVEPFEFADSLTFNETIDGVYEAMRGPLKSNLLESRDEVKAFILSNVYLYAALKMEERKIGFMKFEDPDFPQFRDLWIRQTTVNQAYGLGEISPDPDLNFNSETYAQTLELYDIICKAKARIRLPRRMKEWIDHYLGSVFTLDDDVANVKYSFMSFDRIYLYRVVSGNIERTTITPSTMSLNELFAVIKTYTDVGINNTIKVDLDKALKLAGDKWENVDIEQGWFTPYESYTPTPVSSDTYRQMLINAYTCHEYDENNLNGGSKPWNYAGIVRLDKLTDSIEDDLTTFLCLGAIGNDDASVTDVFHARAISAKAYAVYIFASEEQSVQVHRDMIQTLDHVTMTKPFQLIITSKITRSEYVGVNVNAAEATAYYNYPDGATSHTAGALSCRIATDYELNISNKLLSTYGPNWESQGYNNYVLLVPLCKVDSINALCLRSTFTIGDLPLIASTDIMNEFQAVIVSVYPETGIAADLVNGTPVWVPNDTGTVTSDYVVTISGDDQLLTVRGTVFGVGNAKFASSGISLILPNGINVARTESPEASIRWITGTYLPGTDIGEQFMSYISEESGSSANVSLGYFDYASWMFTALGYSIPIYTVNDILVTVNGTEKAHENIYYSLLKEDYVPYTVKINDLGWIFEVMINGLMKIV